MMFLFLVYCLIKVLRPHRKAYCYSFVYFSLIFIIILPGSRIEFFSRFSTDFHEIFREDVFQYRDVACKVMRKNALPVYSYLPFSHFLKTSFVHASSQDKPMLLHEFSGF